MICHSVMPVFDLSLLKKAIDAAATILQYTYYVLLKSRFKSQILNSTKISVQQKTIMTTHIRSNMITYLVPSYKENKKCQSSISI